MELNPAPDSTTEFSDAHIMNSLDFPPAIQTPQEPAHDLKSGDARNENNNSVTTLSPQELSPNNNGTIVSYLNGRASTGTVLDEEESAAKRTARKSFGGVMKMGRDGQRRHTVEFLVSHLTEEGGTYFGVGVTSKQLLDYSNSLPENERPNRSKNHLQVQLSRAVEKGTLVRLAPSLYTTTQLSGQFPEFYSHRAPKKEAGGEPKSPPLPSLPSIPPPPLLPKSVQGGNTPPETGNGTGVDEKSEQRDAFMQGQGLISKSESEKKRKENPNGKNRPARKRTKKNLGPEFVQFTSANNGGTGGDRKPKGHTCERCGYGTSNILNKFESLMTCKQCPKKYHPSCLGYSEELAAKCKKPTWHCLDCKFCTVCTAGDNPDSLMLCDGCDDAIHTYCNDPPVTEKPPADEQWFCFKCKNETTKQQSSSTDTSPSHQTKSPTKKKLPKLKKVTSNGISLSTSTEENGNCCDKESMSSPLTDEKEILPDLSRDDIFRAAGEEAAEWNTSNVRDFITGIGFKEEAQAFYDQEIDGQALLLLKRTDVLSRLSLKLGPALKLYRRIVALQLVYERNYPGLYRDINQNGLAALLSG